MSGEISERYIKEFELLGAKEAELAARDGAEAEKLAKAGRYGSASFHAHLADISTERANVFYECASVVRGFERAKAKGEA